MKGTSEKVIDQKWGFLGSLPLTKNLLTSLVKNVLLQLELTVATSATDRPIRKNIYGSGIET